jgi:hypothetical protein
MIGKPGAQRLALVVGVAVAGGALLASADVLAQKTLPFPWVNLTGSPAVWVLGAFGIGLWARGGGLRPAIAGGVLLLTHQEILWLLAPIVTGDGVSVPWVVMWTGFGILVGALFGTAGAWSRRESGRLRIAGLALPGAALLGEAGALAYHSGDLPELGNQADDLQTAAILLILAVVVTLAFGRTTRQRLQGLAASAPLALAGFCLFSGLLYGV